MGIAAAVAALLVAAFLLLSFGWSLMRGTIERTLSRTTGRTVTIGAIARVGGLSLNPILELRDVRVAQPAWAGAGDLLRLRAGRIRLPLLPLLHGKIDPQAIAVDGLRLALVRDAQGRANWKKDEGKAPSGAGSPDLGHMTVHDAKVTLDDAAGQRRLAVDVAIDGSGLRVAGGGSVAGNPARLELVGAPVAEQRAWPFRLKVTSPLVSLAAAGRMRTPLDFGHFTARVATSGHDLHDLDRLIEAGLFATQPFRLTATVRHDRPAWFVDDLAGSVGRSQIAGAVAVHKHGERTLIEGQVRSTGFDFDDLASDAGLAHAAARTRVTGPRFFPETSIDLAKLRRTDGTLHVDIARLLSKGPSDVHSLKGSLTLDHGVLTVAPLVIGLTQGRILGTMIVRHQSGLPQLRVEARLVGARLEQLITTPATATGALAARFRLTGSGENVRTAVGASSGTIGFYAAGGTTDRRIAFAAGADVGRALLADAGQRVPLRCLGGRLEVSHGIARPAPLLLDSSVSRADGSGTVNLGDERLALVMRGTSKRAGGLRIEGPIRIVGTIKQPKLELPREVKSAHGILSMIGHALSGHQPVAGDADCKALAARALG